MPSNKPVLLFDGDCGFCRLWTARWKKLTGDRVDYAPSQEAAGRFPEIPPEDFQKSVQLIEPDGRRSSGARAVFAALGYAGHSGWLRAYEKVPGFAAFAEFAYGVVAGHRPAFSSLTRWLWGAPPEPSSCRQTRWIFLRALGLVYGVAFVSYGMQVRGLIGAQGILPAQDFLNHLARFGSARFWYAPTLAWLNASDSFLVGLCAAGVLASLLIFLNVLPRLSLGAAWLLYLSLVSVGGDFFSFQWDVLLLETGFLAAFFAPAGILPQIQGAAPPSRTILFLLRWLLFRLMVQSALVKWLSGDALWHHVAALTVHYQTQPLPNPLSWYVHQWPAGFHRTACVLVFMIEGLVPFLMWGPRRARLFAFWALAGFQGLILLTGNYAFFNWLTLALCLLLLDDSALRYWLPAWCEEPPASRHSGESRNPVDVLGPGFRRGDVNMWLGAIAWGVILFLTTVPFARLLGLPLPFWVLAPAEMMSPIRSFNSYGLFAVMTPARLEIVLDGSRDGKTWRTYEFKYKPGKLNHRPAQAAPFQPRLDWQMWFAALGDYRENPWFLNFCARLLEGSKPVLDLLADNPFPDHPPEFVRATLYKYRFTTPEERRRTGNWWSRDYQGLYCPILSRDAASGLGTLEL